MTDLYRQELDIPDKPKPFGWFLLILGAIMVIIAGVFFYQEALEREKFLARPVIVQPRTAPAAPQLLTPEKTKAAREKARKLIWAVAVALGLVFVFVLAAVFSHRIALHFRRMTDKPLPKTTFSDPWKESAERMKIPPAEE
jgi:uncharacterized membrane protein YhaH (DUF805 family)